MTKKTNYAIWILVLLIVIFSILNTILIFKLDERGRAQESYYKAELELTETKLEKKLTEVLQSIPVAINGKDGKDGKSVIGDKGDKGDKGDRGNSGIDGLTPELRCNLIKNRWEIRYSTTVSWQVLNGEPVKCSIEAGL